MNSVLVAMFDSQKAADDAKSKLVDAGFTPGAVTMTGGSPASSPMSTGAGTTGTAATEGGISHFFSSLFGGNDDASASTYQEAFRRGAYSLSVTATSDAELDRAEAILNAAGAVDIDEKSQQWRNEGWTGASASAASTGETLAAGATRKLQEVEEELKVGKRAVARGGVRIFSRVVEVPVEESIQLREETANVQRRTVDRPATEADFAAFKEGSFEVREMAEEAVVSKTARVVGEVEIGKTVTEREETVRDTVRQTKVDVEEIVEGQTTGARASTASTTAWTGAAGTSGSAGTSGMGTSGTADTAGSANRDPISGELGAHPIGTGVGAAAGGMAAGAAVGTVAGPIGTAVGAAVGAVAGGLAGKGVAEKVDPTVPTAKKPQ